VQIRTGRNAVACLIVGAVFMVVGLVWVNLDFSWGRYVALAGVVVTSISIPPGFGSPWK